MAASTAKSNSPRSSDCPAASASRRLRAPPSEPVKVKAVPPSQFEQGAKLHQPVAKPPRGSVGQHRGQFRGRQRIAGQEQRHGLIGAPPPQFQRHRVQPRRPAGQVGKACAGRAVAISAQ